MNIKTLVAPRRHPTETLADLTYRNRQAIAQVRQTGQHPAIPVTGSQPATRITEPPVVHPLPPMTPPPAQPPPQTTTEPGRKQPRRRSLVSKQMGFLLLGVGVVVALLVIWNQLLAPALGWGQDQWHYGDSRITQMDANVGHGGTSHFLATFSKGEIVIIEIPLDHPNNDQVYTLTGFLGTSGTPVILLSVQDLAHNGKPDLLVQVEGTSFATVLYNTGKAFSLTAG